MVTITRHIFIHISQTEHFPAVKFAIGYEKIISFLVIAKSPKVGKRVETIGLGFFKSGSHSFTSDRQSFIGMVVTLQEWSLLSGVSSFRGSFHSFWSVPHSMPLLSRIASRFFLRYSDSIFAVGNCTFCYRCRDSA